MVDDINRGPTHHAIYRAWVVLSQIKSFQEEGWPIGLIPEADATRIKQDPAWQEHWNLLSSQPPDSVFQSRTLLGVKSAPPAMGPTSAGAAFYSAMA